MKTLIKVTSTFIVGAAAGLLAGLLLAPNSGKKTREKISEESHKLQENLLEALNKNMEVAKDEINKGLDNLNEKGKKYFNGKKETVS